MSGAYYNEINLVAAQWLRNLIKARLIADGVVDTRSIEDVRPSDLRGFTQCHFFAGIGGWSLALRRAGWTDDRSIWSGSCPCQPFSAAGKGIGFADERHLWPSFGHLIAECQPSVVVGEQVASKDVDDWIDLVHADLEAMGYAFGSVPFPSAGIGSPQLRDRNYWGAISLAHSSNKGPQKQSRERTQPERSSSPSLSSQLGNATRERCEEEWRISVGPTQRTSDAGAAFGGLADTNSRKRDGFPILRGAEFDREDAGRSQSGSEFESSSAVRIERPSPTNGLWRVADWLGCTDDKWRPVEPGSFPLADGVSGRVGRLCAYGNSINPEAGRVFMESLMECMP